MLGEGYTKKLPDRYKRMLRPIVTKKVILMANQANSLSHTKWMCKYHIVMVPKYRRKQSTTNIEPAYRK